MRYNNLKYFKSNNYKFPRDARELVYFLCKCPGFAVGKFNLLARTLQSAGIALGVFRWGINHNETTHVVLCPGTKNTGHSSYWNYGLNLNQKRYINYSTNINNKYNNDLNNLKVLSNKLPQRGVISPPPRYAGGIN